jgi:hypothetical protein
MAHALLSLGSLRRDQGDDQSALSHLGEGLDLYHAIGDRQGIAWCLEGLAGLATAAGRPEQGANFIGTAARLREEMRSPIQRWEAPTLAAIEAMTRAALGDEAFAAARAIGRATAVEDAVVAAADLAGAPVA